MANRTKFDPLQSDYTPQAGDVLVGATMARVTIRSIEGGDVCFDVNHGSQFVESRRLPAGQFAEMARNQAIALTSAMEGGCDF